MIAQLTGTLLHKAPHSVIVDVGGIGYQAMISLNSYSELPDIGTSLTLHTHTHLREDQLALFGFITLEERTIFQKLIAVSGVGPKMALTILSGIPSFDLVNAIGHKDAQRLQSIPGVGKKTAERIIVELQDKLAKEIEITESPTAKTHTNRLYDDVVSALINLGYQKLNAEKAIRKANWDENTTIETAIRETLKEIAKT